MVNQIPPCDKLAMIDEYTILKVLKQDVLAVLEKMHTFLKKMLEVGG